MKRMIACEECLKRPAPFYPGEWFLRVIGIAKKPMLCDWCSPPKEIKPGDICAAESMGVEGRGIPYSEWESEYID